MPHNTTTSFDHLTITALNKWSEIIFEPSLDNCAMVKTSLGRINVIAKHCLINLANGIIMRVMPRVGMRANFVFGVGC